MARSNRKSRRHNSGTVNRLLAHRWLILRVIAIAIAVAMIAILRDLIFAVIGFGLILWVIWAGVVVFMVWTRRWRSLFSRGNLWLGILSLTFATWGILALFHPSAFTIGDTEFANVSLGGESGKYLIGNQGVGALPPLSRIALFILGGVALIAPRTSLKFLKLLGRAARAAVLAILSSGKWLLTRSGRQLARLYHKYPLHRLLARPIIALGRELRSRRAPESETAARPSTSKPHASQAKVESEAVAVQGQLLPPDIFTEEEAVPPQGPKAPAPKPSGIEAGQLPAIELLDTAGEAGFTEADNEQRARLIEEAFASYGVEAKVAQINPGPSVTQFGIEPGWDRKYKRIEQRNQQGKVQRDKDGNAITRLEEISNPPPTRVKVERITALSNNLSLALAVPSIRIEAPVPGKSLVGIEVPNTTTALVPLRSVIDSQNFQKVKIKSKLAISLGKGAAGEPIAADLSKMPHLLIAGTTGSGKTVCLNSIIVCLLMHNLPQDVRLLLIDPKRVELVSFDGVPHLISPVVVEVDKAIDSLKRVTREMDNRYKKFSAYGVRNIEGYNRSMLITEPMPYLVVVVDELADLMMTAAEVVEPSICRLAQLARATGIHLIIATQRPSVDVVTGLIKANFPTRIAFAVASLVDSRTILDTSGAEKLLGRGDMLYMPPDIAKPKRLRGCYSSDQEIDRVVEFWKQRQDIYPPQTEDTVAKDFASLETEEVRADDTMLASARSIAKDSAHISTSLLQRRLHIGYPRAARIMDSLEREGIISRSEPGSPAEFIESDIPDMEVEE